MYNLKRLARSMLNGRCMTHTEFITREKHGGNHGFLSPERIRFHASDGAIILGFLAMFVGLVLLLSK
jgi:hypothetical protein